MMKIIVYVVFVVVLSTEAWLKDIDRNEDRPEEQPDLFEGDILLTAEQRAIMDEVTHEERRPEEQGHLFEGDIMLTAEQRAIIDESILGESIGDNSAQRKATSSLAQRWPNGEVPYVISTVPNEANVRAAIAHWEQMTCIKFIPRTNQNDYVQFVTSSSGGCSSYLGKTGGKQNINLSDWCVMGNIAHEIGHAIGFWHEQSRPDRDDYITVHLDNIRYDARNNFNKKTWAEVVTHNIAYDVGSIMHYGQYGFSVNGRATITANNPADNAKLGQRDGLSPADVKLAKAIYGCEGTDCLAGWDIENRGNPDSPGWTMVSPSKVITCDGSVSEWRYQAKASHPFRAVVWRQVAGATTQFKIVGINDIPAGAINTEVSYQVPANERIAVKTGDMIGWSFGEGVLTYNAGGGTLVRWIGGNLHASLEENQIRDINAGSQDREYSIKATVAEGMSGTICLAGWDIGNRGGPDSAGWTMVSPSKVITCDGSVSEWRYQVKASHPFRAVVWRQVAGTSTQFKIVGINDIPAGVINTEVTYQVPANERIAVKTGDMIGWSFGEGVLTYNSGGGALVRWVGGNLHASLVKNQIRDINGGSQNREYSIKATVAAEGTECFAGWDTENRGGPDSAGWTMVSPSKVISCDGSVSEWRYQAKASHPFRAVVWRQVAGATTQFKIVGINDIPAGAINTEVSYQVPANERIAVKAGDMIGWSFGEGVLTYNAGGGTLVRWIGGNLHASLEENQIRDINAGSQDREYSIKATVAEGTVCLAGWDIGNRGGPDSAGWTMVSPSKVITCDGSVSEWRYQVKASHPFRAVVWRQVAGTSTQFKIVGINDIPAGAINTEVSYQVPANERIAVKTGDMIGWSFGEGVLTYNAGGGALVRWVGGNLHASLVENQIRDINGGSQNREYSIEATVVEA